LLNTSLITAQGIDPWRYYLIARALENRVPIVAPNPYLGARVPGKSELLGLSYKKPQGIMLVRELVKPVSGARLYVANLAFDDEAAALRRERLSERQPKAYFKDQGAIPGASFQ